MPLTYMVASFKGQAKSDYEAEYDNYLGTVSCDEVLVTLDKLEANCIHVRRSTDWNKRTGELIKT